MSKTEVYSWRLSVETKSMLEEAARRNQSSVSALLDEIVGEWLAQQQLLGEEESEQQCLHEAASKALGTIRGDNPDRARDAKALLRAKLANRRAN